MSSETKAIMLKVPIELDKEITEISKTMYRSKQEFILECVREKLIDKNKKEEPEK